VVTQDALSGIEVIAAKSRTRLGAVARHLGVGGAPLNRANFATSSESYENHRIY
jgi:hypothetical protein